MRFVRVERGASFAVDEVDDFQIQDRLRGPFHAGDTAQVSQYQ
jgi:hypothetical protein